MGFGGPVVDAGRQEDAAAEIADDIGNAVARAALEKPLQAFAERVRAGEHGNPAE